MTHDFYDDCQSIDRLISRLEGESVPTRDMIEDARAALERINGFRRMRENLDDAPDTYPEAARGTPAREHGSLCGCGQCTGYDLPPCARCGAADHGLPACATASR